MLLADPKTSPIARALRSAGPPICLLPRRLHNNRTLGLVGPAPRRHQSAPADRGATSTETAQQVVVDAPEAAWPYPSGAGDDEDISPHAGPVLPSGLSEPQVSFVSLVDGKYTVRGRLVLPVPASRVYSLLTDYGGCHRVFSNIASSEVVHPEGGGLQVVQSCRWRFLAFSGTFLVHLGVEEEPDSGTLLFSLVHSNFMRDFEGRWTVRPAAPPPAAAGAGAGEWCQVEHQLSVVPSVSVPAPVSYYTRSIFVWQVEGILADLQRAVLEAAAAEEEEARTVAMAVAGAAERA